MFEQTPCVKTRSKITALSILNNDLVAFSTQIHGAKIFSSDSCKVTKNISIELLGGNTTAVAFNKNSDLLAFANANIIYIVNINNKIILQTIRTNDGVIELISFVPNSSYIIAGTNTGRVMQYRYDGRSQLSRLCSFGHSKTNAIAQIKNNYVSAFASNKDYFAFSGYGGLITLLKMHSHANKYNIEASKVRVDALCFLDDKRLVSGNADGLVQIHSIKKHQPVKNISTPFVKINKIILMPNPRYIMVSGESNNLIIIDTEIGKVVSTNYLSFKENVSSIMLDYNNDLLVVLDDLKIVKVELPTGEHIKSFILHNQLDKAFEIIEKDPMLQGTREHKRVEVMYEKMLTQAIEALISSNNTLARKLVDSFSTIKSKVDDINAMFKAFEFYPRFKILCIDKNYLLAYAMAEKHPVLKRTLQYKKMEESFKDAFTFAQKQILIGRKDVAKEVLSPFISVVSKKSILQLILNQNEDFIAFLKAVHDKDTKKINALIGKNEHFSQIPTFTELNDSTQKSLDSVKELIKNGQADAAIEMIKSLVNTSTQKETLNELYNQCKLVKKLQASYEANDFKSCYEIIDENDSLDALQLAELLETHWIKLMNTCEEHALKGDIKSIKEVLGDLIGVKTRLNKIGDLIRLSFHIKIKFLLSKKSFKSAENIIYSYIDIFGSDREMLVLMKTYERSSGLKLAISTNQNTRVSRDNWVNSPLIMN